MSRFKMTKRQLNEEIKRWRVPRNKALNNLVRARDLLTALINCKDDVDRIRTWKKFGNLISSPHVRELHLPLVWSKMINDPTYTHLPGRKKVPTGEYADRIRAVAKVVGVV